MVPLVPTYFSDWKDTLLRPRIKKGEYAQFAAQAEHREVLGRLSLKNTLHHALQTFPREAYLFILASLMNSVGSALMWPLTTIYVHNVLHRSYGEAGFVLFCQSLAGVAGQFLGGALFHRLGAKRLIVGSLFLTGFAQFGLIFAKAWSPYIAMMTTVGLLNSITMPAVNAFIGFRWRDQQYRLFNAIYVSNNIGVAIGTSIAGVLAAISFNLTFLFNGVSTVAFAAFFYVFIRRMNIDETSDLSLGVPLQGAEQSIRFLPGDYRLYLFISLGTMLISVSTSAWNSGVAPFLNQKGLPVTTYSLLWTVNGLVILLGQPLLALLNRFVMKTLYLRLIGSAVFYAIGFSFMLFWHGLYFDFVFGMVVATLGEMSISPTSPALITQTAGRAAPFYLGLVGGFGSAGRLIGPVLFGNLFDFFGLNPILTIAAGSTVVAAILFLVHQNVKTRVNSPLQNDSTLSV